jgi:hypothetical protein
VTSLFLIKDYFINSPKQIPSENLDLDFSEALKTISVSAGLKSAENLRLIFENGRKT